MVVARTWETNSFRVGNFSHTLDCKGGGGFGLFGLIYDELQIDIQ